MRALPRHRITDAELAMLASGSGGASMARLLAAAQYSRHALLVYGLVETAEATGHEQAGWARGAYDLLAEIQHRDPKAVEEVLRYPSVGAWARRSLRAMTAHRQSRGTDPAMLAGVAAAAAVRSRTRCCVEIPAIRGTVVLPSLGALTVPGDRCTVIVGSGASDVHVVSGRQEIVLPTDPQAGAPGWLPLRRLVAEADGGRLELILDDVDPFRMPDVPNLAGRLGQDEIDRLETGLNGAWRTLTRHHWTTADEVAALISVVTPLTSSGGGHVSASARETFGCVALSPTDDGLTLAVTLAHEIQHSKLGALLDLVTLTEPDNGCRHYAPWREDPRPVSGLLQGAYAYLGVSGFWRRQRQVRGENSLRAHVNFARWRAAALAAVDTLLASGELTGRGKAFVERIAQTLQPWQAEPVPSHALALAQKDAERHRDRWLHRNRPIR